MARKHKTKMQTLRVYLIKPEYTDYPEIIKVEDKLKPTQLKGSLSFNGKFYLQSPHGSPIKWRDFVNQGLQEELAPFKNVSTSALLLIKTGKRIFAFTFGYGRNLLKPEVFERDFGLKVVLNTVDSENLRSIDAHTFEQLSLHTRKQTSRGSTIDTFGINVQQDFLRAVTGEPREVSFAKRVSGSDGLAIALPIEFADLGKKCKEMLEAYQSTAYRDNGFEFFDNLNRIRDQAKINKLDDILITRFRNDDTTRMHLSPPEPIDQFEIDKFTYSHERHQNEYDDLDINEFFATLPDEQERSLAFLKKIRVGLVYNQNERSHEKWSLYDCINFEYETDGHLYALANGNWFEIERNFADKIAQKVQHLTAKALDLPPAQIECDGKFYEANYNWNTAQAKKCAFLDEANKRIKMGKGRSVIEICDFFTPEKQFVHVKAETKSSRLSHLFAQGFVSAETLFFEKDFRKIVREKIAASNQPCLTQSVCLEKPKPSDYEVAYAIVKKEQNNWPLSLPFFSQLSLSNAADRLERLGFRVSLTRIGVEEKC